MSFDAVRNYARHILRPLGLLDEGAPLPARRTPALPPSTSAAWHASTHTFLGASNRSVPKSWPLERFDDDPAAIVEDRAHDIVYDPQSAEVRAAAGADSPDASFWLYERERKPAGARPEEVPAPWLVAKRYTPSQSGTSAAQQPGVTLLLLPGMGVPKEICEPLIELMLPQFAAAGVKLDEIWTLDMPMSGETALANPRGYLYGNEKDIARDVLHFLTAYLPLQPGGKLEETLPYRAPQGDKARQITRPNLHVAAHSLGAQSALLIAAHAPELFASLTVFDPAIVPPGKILDGFSKLPNDVFCTMLGERWPSRKALREAVKKNKRMGGWDDRIIDAFVERGVVEEADGSLRLAAPPRLEWALYFDKETPSHTFDRIPDVRVPLQAVMPARPFATPPKLFQKIFDGLPQPKRLVWVDNVTHQLFYERLDDSAAHIVSFIKERQAGQDKARL